MTTSGEGNDSVGHQEGSGSHTGYKICHADQYDAHVPQTPEIGCVEQCSRVAELTELIVCKSREPDIQENLSHRYLLWISLDQYSVILCANQ